MIRDLETGVVTGLPFEYAEDAYIGREHVALRLRDEEDDTTSLVTLRGDDRRTITLGDAELLAVGADGEWAALGGEDAALQAVQLRTGEAVKLHGRGADEAALFGGPVPRIAWSAPDGGEGTTVRVRALTGAPGLRTLKRTGWVQYLAFTPDGSEVLMLADRELVRWRWATGEQHFIKDPGLIDVQSVRAAADLRTLHCVARRHVQLRSNDAEMRLLGALHPLQSGGWWFVSRSGAIDGSDDAIDSVVTRVEHASATLVFDGRLGWDGAYVPGAAARAFAGEDAAPPVLPREPAVDE